MINYPLQGLVFLMVYQPLWAFARIMVTKSIISNVFFVLFNIAFVLKYSVLLGEELKKKRL